MAAVEITEVSIPRPDYNVLYGAHIEAPKAGDQLEVYRLEITGWVLGRTSPAVTVELLSADGALLRRATVTRSRPDIAEAFPEAEGAATSGFQIAVNGVSLEPEFSLRVEAVLAGNQRLELASIRGRRQPLGSGAVQGLRPLFVTTLGRTGSSWLMLLLAQHPSIVAYRPFEWEPRVATYWLAVLKTLSEPASYLQIINPDLAGPTWWTGQNHPEHERRTADLIGHVRNKDPQMFQWLGKTQIEALVRLAQGRIEGFYQQAAEVQGRTSPVFFAEKHWPDPFIVPMMWELYPDARELFLVRDFRDIICSVLSFNKKLGYDSFGRQRAKSDGEYIGVFRGDAEVLLQEWKRRAHRSHLVRYEDLILKPEETLKPVFDHLGLESRDDRVAQVLNSAHQTAADAQKGHQTSGGPAASIGRWKRDLDPSMQALCHEQLGELLTEFGYEM